MLARPGRREGCGGRSNELVAPTIPLTAARVLGNSDWLATFAPPPILPAMSRRRLGLLVGLTILGSGVAGCVERTMTIKSDPPGALVYMNDQELGRTPLKRDFLWYGNYDVEIRKDGYETLKLHQNVKAPWWGWVPFDLFAELIPTTLKDHHELAYTLKPAEDPAAVDATALEQRAEQLRGELRSSQYTRTPTTKPATKPAATTQPAK